MFDIQSIDCTPGDVLIVQVDFDLYDKKSLDDLEKTFKEVLPENKIIFVPDDVISAITTISSKYKFNNLYLEAE